MYAGMGERGWKVEFIETLHAVAPKGSSTTSLIHVLLKI